MSKVLFCFKSLKVNHLKLVFYYFMEDATKLFLLTLGLAVAAAHTAHAQLGVGNGTTAPRTMLDVNGAFR
jgi:hypothetical protein